MKILKTKFFYNVNLFVTNLELNILCGPESWTYTNDGHNN